MKRIKVLALIWDMGNGGAQKILINNLRAFKDDPDIDFKAVVYCAPSENSNNDRIIEAEKLNVRYLNYPKSIIRIPIIRFPFNKIVQRREWKKVLLEEKADIVHVHISELLRITLDAIKNSNVIAAFDTLHSNPFRYKGLNLWYIRRAFCKYGVIPICLNDLQVTQAKEHYHITRSEIVHNGIDFEGIKRKKVDSKVAREELGLSESSFIVLAVGRLDKVKNYELLIDVFKNISDKRNDAILVIAGGGDSSIYMQRVRNYCLEEKVLFLGNVKDVVPLYCSADRYVMTSFSEASPLALLEAQTCGVPCIVSAGVPKESAISKLVYYMEPDATINEWTDAIIRGEGGYEPQFTEDDYSIEKANKSIKDLYIRYYKEKEI